VNNQASSITICGLPESGKTTFIAALWHLVTESVNPYQLRLASLFGCDNTYLNEISAKWRRVEKQARTDLRSFNPIIMNLKNSSDKNISLSIPDISGEAFSQMWEKRKCDRLACEAIKKTTGLLLFINITNIKYPITIIEQNIQMKKSGKTYAKDEELVKWDERLAPTQAQLVDIMQSFSLPPIEVKLNRVAILLTAWDAAKPKVRPEDFLQEELCLLHQYISNNIPEWKVYGVSAQGGSLEMSQQLKAMDLPSERIIVETDGKRTNDLSLPIAWLAQ
jgi:GTPase SAR1 family protein